MIGVLKNKSEDKMDAEELKEVSIDIKKGLLTKSMENDSRLAQDYTMLSRSTFHGRYMQADYNR
jgi:hypothetical protein